MSQSDTTVLNESSGTTSLIEAIWPTEVLKKTNLADMYFLQLRHHVMKIGSHNLRR